MNTKEKALMPLKGRFSNLIGRETLASELCSTLKSAIQMWKIDTVGAMLVTSSDEAEHENADAFYKNFCSGVLPRLKIGGAPPFRLANLGGRYEWMSLATAEPHFISRGKQTAAKMVLVKINSHVAIRDDRSRDPEFGVMLRHDLESDCCSTLMGALKGENTPAIKALTESWHFDGLDRLSLLQEIPQSRRALFAAILSARMQARSCVLEAQDMSPASPTLFIILPCVSINRSGRDGELPVGVYLIDRRSTGRQLEIYHGLSDRPDGYQMSMKHGRVVISDTHFSEFRNARDHRQMIRHEAAAKIQFKPTKTAEDLLKKLKEAGSDQSLQRKLLKGMLKTMLEASPIGTAAILFGNGALGIWNTYKTHQLIKDATQTEEARDLVAEVHRRIDHMPPEQAAALLTSLAEAYQK